jgi:hypothetical protein
VGAQRRSFAGTGHQTPSDPRDTAPADLRDQLPSARAWLARICAPAEPFNELEVLETALVELDRDLTVARAEEFDEFVCVVIRTFPSALHRIDVLMRVLGGKYRGWLAERTEHQMRGHGGRVRVPDLGGDELSSELSFGQNGRKGEHRATAGPAIGAVRVAGSIIERDRHRDLSVHVHGHAVTLARPAAATSWLRCPTRGRAASVA